MPKVLFAAQRSVQMDAGDHVVELPTDSMGLSRRTVSATPEVIRSANDVSETLMYRGHAAVFDTPAWIGSRSSGFWETINRGAFAKAILENDVRFLINHDPNLVLGRNKAGTLRLTEDPIGLGVEADLPDTSYARDHAVSLARGDVTQMSFGFAPKDYVWSRHTDGKDLLAHRSLMLADVSSVTFPAYVETDGGLRAAAFDLMCRAAGFDNSQVESILRRAFDGGEITMDEAKTIESAGQDESTRTEDKPQASTTAPAQALRMKRLRMNGMTVPTPT